MVVWDIDENRAEETNGIIQEIASDIEHFSRRPLYSTREFKKVRIK